MLYHFTEHNTCKDSFSMYAHEHKSQVALLHQAVPMTTVSYSPGPFIIWSSTEQIISRNEAKHSNNT
jgi:hypothetical protein